MSSEFQFKEASFTRRVVGGTQMELCSPLMELTCRNAVRSYAQAAGGLWCDPLGIFGYRLSFASLPKLAMPRAPGPGKLTFSYIQKKMHIKGRETTF